LFIFTWQTCKREDVIFEIQPVEETPLIKQPKKTLFRKIQRIFFSVILIILAFILALLALLFIYQDEVKTAIISELNAHLKAEVKINPKDIDLTIIKSFPDCSMEFKNMLMLEALPIKNRDTLLFAGQLNLYFSIADLWNKKYDIQKIKLKDALVKLQVLKNGKTNYVFWNSENAKPNQKSDSLNFNLNLITIENCKLFYKDKQHLFKTELDIKSIDFKGNFSDTRYDLESSGKLFIHQITHQKNTFLKKKTCNYAVKLKVEGDKFTIDKAGIDINQLALDLNGGFTYKDDLKDLQLRYVAPNLDIASVMSLLPEQLKDKIADYESAGNFYAKGLVNYTNKNTYSVESNFGVANGEITYKPQSTKLSGLNLEGELKLSSKASSLTIKNIRLKLNNDELQGNCFIKDFENPYVKISAQANLHLENLQAFYPIDTLQTLKGSLTINSDIEGLINDLKNKTFSTQVKLELDAVVHNLEAQFKGDETIYAIENCSVTAKEREVEVKELKLKRGSSDIVLNGKIPGVFNYLMDKTAPLIIEGNLFSNYLKLEDFMLKYKSAESADAPLIPANVEFKLNAAILKFSYAKFEAQSITGQIEIENQKAIISDMKLQAMQGSAEIDVYADNSKNNLDIVLQSNLSNINVTDLFFQFDNFGQSTMIDKNIKGFASATIDFSGSWTNKLDVDYNTIKTVCDLNIERGELIDFKPLLSLSKFVDVQDLQRIKFSSLKSKIQIADKLITIPKTEIKNSALNIDFWGTHSFNNDIDYHIQLLISELLAKKRKNQDNEFGPIENDKSNKRSAFVLMTGTVDKPVIKYDRKGLKDKIKNDIKEEKQSIKQLFKEEFGLFKKDSIHKKTNKSDQVFELENPNNNKPKKTLEPKKKADDDEDF
jgi:hypothetical protein